MWLKTQNHSSIDVIQPIKFYEVYSINLKNWLRRLCKSSGPHVLLYAAVLGLQTDYSFPS